MSLSRDLVEQFAKLTVKQEEKKEVTVRGTYKKIGDVEYVQLDGSDILTPVTSTVEAETGEKVTVLIKNHTATVTGNISSPSARSKSVEDLKDEVDEHGNTIKQIDNTITQQGNSIIQIDNNIKQMDNTILQQGNTINQQGNKIQQLDNTIIQQGDNIDSMNNTIKQHSNDIEAINNTIEQHDNTIKQHDNTIIQQGNTIVQQGNTIKQYGSNIETINSDVKILNSGFKIENGVLTGLSKVVVDELETNTLNAKYASIDFSNIGEAAIEKLFADSGIIKDLIVSDGKITGELVGVTIKGDLIEANTLKADKLVILGEDGLYYKLNVNALGEATASSDEKYQNGLDGSVIVAESITAEKIAVDDLVAFKATIGGFHIGDHALYSGVKSTVSNTTRGVYLGDDGQLNIGDSKNFLKLFVDEKGQYKLEISASALKFSAGGSVEDSIKDVNDSIKDLVKSTEVEYYLSTSTETLSGGSWQTEAPAWEDGKYMWSRTKITLQNGTITYKPSENGTCIAGATGPEGPQGDPADLTLFKEAYGNPLQLTECGQFSFKKFVLEGGHKQDGVATPDNPIEIKTVGKVEKLFDGNFRQGDWSDTTDPQSLYSTQNYFVKANKTYTMFTNLDTSIFRWGVNVGEEPFPTNKVFFLDSGWLLGSEYTFTPTKDGYLGITITRQDYGHITPDDTKNISWKLIEGTEEASPSVEIKVSNEDDTENQLVKMPVQKEMLDGDYIADKEHHGWGKFIGNENSNSACNHNVNNKVFEFRFEEILNANDKSKTICNMATHWKYSWKENGCFVSYQGKFMILCKDDEFGFRPEMTTDEALAHFKSILAETNLVAYYKLATPEELDLTEEQQAAKQQLDQIRLYYDITNVSANNELAKMDIEYWTYYKGLTEDDLSDLASNKDLNDAKDDFNNRIDTAQSTIEQLSNMISNLVTDENGGSLMTQTKDGWTFNMSSITGNLEAIKDAMVNMENDHSESNSALDRLTDLVDEVAKKTAYITMTTDENGDPCIELGKSDNPFKVRITNTAIDFLEGSTRIAYATNRIFYTEKLIVKSELQIGEGPGYVWKTRPSGNMGLVYISGEGG